MRRWLVRATLALLVGLAGPVREAGAWVWQSKSVVGPQVNQTTYNRACYRYAGGDFWYYFAYTDSVYTPDNRYHVFLHLEAADGPLSSYVFTADIKTTERGIVSRTGTPPVSSCQGATTTTEFAVKDVTTTSLGVYSFTPITYAEYVSLAQSLGLIVYAQFAQIGYLVVDLGAPGGSSSITNAGNASCPDPSTCPVMQQPLQSPYVSVKSLLTPQIRTVLEEVCGDGLDNNGNGLVDETCRAGAGAGGGPTGRSGGGAGPGPTPGPTGGGGGCSSNSEQVSSSCELASGNLSQSPEPLAFAGGPLALGLSATYNSLDPAVGPLGRGWTHTYAVRLGGDNGLTLGLVDGQGSYRYYRKEGTSAYYPQARGGPRDRIVRQSDGSYHRLFQDGTLWRFAGGRLLEIRDRNQLAVTLTYAGSLLARVQDPYGHWIDFTYDASNRIVQASDSAGRTVSFVYDTGGANQLLSILDAAGGHWDFTYDASGRMLTKRDPRGAVSTYAYGSADRLASVTDPQAVTRQLSYTPSQKTTRVVEPDGATKVQTWDGRLNVPLSVTDATGRVTRYTYDGFGNRLTMTDPAGGVTRYTYDAEGRLLTRTNPLTQTTTYTYDPATNQVATRTDPDGAVTRYAYDTRANLTQVTDPTGRVTQFGYDAAGHLVTVTDPAGQTTTLSYDAQHQLVATTDAAGVTLQFAYDAVGRLTSVTDAAGATTTSAYDALNRLVSVVDPLIHTTSFAYDGLGHRTAATDALGRVTQFAYDARGLLTSVTDPAGGVTAYAYDARRRLTSLTDAAGRATTYTYDAAGRVLTETGPLGDVTTYQYDARGLLQFKTTPKGETIESRYDAAGRITDRLYPGGTEGLTYDANGRVATAAGGGVTYTFAYDAAGRVTSVTDSRGYTVSYSYDAAGRRQTLTYPGGQQLTYGYDAAGRLTTLLDGARTITLGYDALGRRASLTHPNGTQTTYGYDLASRLTGITHATSGGAPVQTFTYGYDAADARTSLATLAQTFTYTYDLATRLTGVTATPATPLPAEAFSYDAVGNRLTGPSPADSSTYNAGHQLLTGPGTTYSYDLNGNRATKTDASGTTTYTWDAVNRLVQAAVPTATGTMTVSFAYDALGRRVRKTVAETSGGVTTTTTTEYVYDQEDVIWQVETVQVGGGVPTTTTTRFVHGPGVDEPLLVDDGAAVYAVHADALGSVTGLSDGSQTLVEASTYTSFGELARSGGMAGNGYAYTGREWEPESALYYYRARYYDPEAGRFLSRDPIGFEGSDSNLYAYVAADPMNWVDPAGLDRYWVCDYVALSDPACRKCVDAVCDTRVGRPWCCEADFKGCKSEVQNKYEPDAPEWAAGLIECQNRRQFCSGQPPPKDPPEQWNGRDPKGYGDPFPGPIGRPPKVPNRDDRPWQPSKPNN